MAGDIEDIVVSQREGTMQSEFDGHMKTGTFHAVDRVPEGQKPVSSKWGFDYKTDKEGR